MATDATSTISCVSEMAFGVLVYKKKGAVRRVCHDHVQKNCFIVPSSSIGPRPSYAVPNAVHHGKNRRWRRNRRGWRRRRRGRHAHKPTLPPKNVLLRPSRNRAIQTRGVVVGTWAKYRSTNELIWLLRGTTRAVLPRNHVRTGITVAVPDPHKVCRFGE